MSNQNPPSLAPRNSLFYGWIIVAACSLMVFVTYGLQYSFSVFFKPLAEHFQWDRSTVSFIYSSSLVIRGAVSVGTGWLADRYGARPVMIVCGALMGAGFLLSSRITELWQFFLTYAVIEAIGFSGTFGVGTAMVSRWFKDNRRGLALGIVASGSGLGTLILVPGIERLIDAVDWSQAFFYSGIFAGVFMIGSALTLRPPPAFLQAADASSATPPGMTLKEALRDRRLWLIFGVFLTFFFGTQIIMVHLVNYATDNGIDPLVAATFIGTIGAVSIAGRLGFGIWANKLGIFNSLFITGGFLVLTMILLLFTRSTWSFYVFAVLFAIPYGGEVTQIPLVMGKYFGLRALATIMGLSVAVTVVGAAAGPWAAGKIFDATGSYDWAFIAGAISGVISLGFVFLLKLDRPAEAR